MRRASLLIVVAVAAVTLAVSLAAGATHRPSARLAGLRAPTRQHVAGTPFPGAPAPLSPLRPRARQFFAIPGPEACEIADSGGCSLVPCTEFAAAAATPAPATTEIAPATGRQRCLPARPRALAVATAPLVAIRAVAGR